MQAELEKIIREVADELGIPQDIAIKAYMTQWDFILDKITSLPLKDIESVEEFRTLRPNFNLPSFGKLYVTESKFLRQKKVQRGIQKLIEERKQEQNVQD